MSKKKGRGRRPVMARDHVAPSGQPAVTPSAGQPTSTKAPEPPATTQAPVDPPTVAAEATPLVRPNLTVRGDRARFVFSGTLVVESPLHVGSGDHREFAFMRPSGNNLSQWPAVALLTRDADDRPYLPGSTIKGLLRRIAEARLTPPAVTALCGEIKRATTPKPDTAPSETAGTMGAMLVRGASRNHSGDATGMPYADLGSAELGEGVFIAARTAIDPATGTADRNKLFFHEMAAPGTTFPLTIILETRRSRPRHSGQPLPPEDDVTFLRRVEDLFAWFCAVLESLREQAWPIGKGQADGQGRVRLRPGYRIDQMAIDPDTGAISLACTPPSPSERQPARASKTWVLHLHCPGPFMIADSSHEPAAEQTRDTLGADDPLAAQLKAQRGAGNVPLVLGPSVMGALRARAEWLTALACHQAGKPPPTMRGTEVHGIQDIAKLSPNQRLFGETGFRGMLALETITTTNARPWNVSSVKLDRFSGAPFDQALFTSATFVDTRLTVTLRLQGRGTEDPTGEDIALAKSLLRDLRDDGLLLGHATNRGFGWFDCVRIEGDLEDA